MGGRDESPLFYTPPPGEKPVSFTGAFDDDSDDAGTTAFPGAAVRGRTLYYTQGHAQIAQLCTSCIPNPFLLNLFGSGVLNRELNSSPLRQQTSHSEQDRCPNMSPTGRSLTLFDDPSNDPAKYHNHPSSDRPYKSLNTNPVSPSPIPSSISTTKPRPTQGSQSLEQLAGYATSEDEPERALKQSAKKFRPKNTIVYKSAEFIASDSGESDASPPQPRQARSSRTSASLKHHERATGTVSRLEDQTRKTKNMTAMKRPTSALASCSMAKRPNIRGGFVMDSESDDEGNGQSDQDDNDNQSRSSIRQTSHALEPPRFIQANLKSDSSVTSLPTKQLNKSRLNKLLGRGKGVTTTPKQKQLLVHTQPPIPTIPAPSATSHLAASLRPQQSASSQSAGSRNADRAKGPTTADTTREVKVLSQQVKVLDSSMTKTDGKVSSISRKIPQPTAVITDHGRTPMQTSSVSTPPTTAALGSSSSPLLQQRRNDMSGNKAFSATQARSLLQLTLDEAKIGTIRNTLGAQPQVSSQDEQKIAKRTPISTTLTRKSGLILQPCVKEHETTEANATFKKCSSSAIQSPKVSEDVASQRVQRHTQAPDPGPRKSTPAASKANAASSKPTPSTPGPSAQKRKLDSISGGSDNISIAAPKRPAPSLEPLLKRPEITQAVSKVDTSSRAVTASKAVLRKAPTETTKCSGFATTASITGSNLSSAWTISEHKPGSILPSPAVSTLVGRQGSGVPTSSNPFATPVISHLPVHARKAAIDKPVEGPRTSNTTLLPQAKSVDRPGSFATVPTKPNSGKSQDSTKHASVTHDTATSAQHNDSSSGVIATSSSELHVSSKRPTANKSGDDILGLLPKGSPHRVAVTPYPEKALSLSINTRPEESRQVAEPGLAIQRQHGSTSTSSPAKVPQLVTTEPLFSATRKGPISAFSTTVPKPAPLNELQATDLVELVIQETALSVPSDSMKNAVLRSDETRTDDIEMDVDSVGATAIVVQRGDASADTVSVPRTANDHEPSNQLEKATETRDGSPLLSLKPALPKHMITNAPEIASTPSVSPPIHGLPSLEVITDSKEDVLLLSCSSQVSREAQPYFEYSVFQKVWSSEQAEENITATEITVRPFTSISEANGQAEKAFQGSRAHFFDAIFESSATRDEHGCSIFTGSVTPYDNPIKKNHLKIWVQRDIVSRFANQTPQTLRGTSFISSTCYILRLFNLAEQADIENSDASDSDDSDSPACESVRVYQSHSRPEIYTTLDAANRAARALQIELSHEKEPQDEFSRKFQERNLRELDTKLRELQSREVDGGDDGCWKSKFNACGLGADTLEVTVEKTSICGPRNL